MSKLMNLVPSHLLQYLSEDECFYLENIFTEFNGFPTVAQLWRLMDEQWLEFECDPLCNDERISSFYRHPVWLLNGLFVEQDQQSIKNRIIFSEWVVENNPLRIADFGGGFGGLARLIGSRLKNSIVEVVEPHPHPAAMAIAESTPNVRFVTQLVGEYDLLIATDVFEHVFDPIELIANTASHLSLNGNYLIANCFQPIILCHLPQHLYLNIAWESIMNAMGLGIKERVHYGAVYGRKGVLDISSARKEAERGRLFYSWIRYLPRGQARVGRALLSWTGK